MTDKARILIFTGDGKGKTTAAIGMMLRAVGHDKRVAIARFIKNDQSTGELAALKRLGVKVAGTGMGFIPGSNTMAFAKHQQAAAETLKWARSAIASGQYDMVVMDEICVAVAKALLTEQEVLSLMQDAPDKLVLVLTGRGATKALQAAADTVSDIRPVKHAYQMGVAAQEGVEF